MKLIKTISIVILTAFLLYSFMIQSKNQPQDKRKAKVELTEKASEKKIDVMIDGKLFTSYTWRDDVCKPVLYPVCASSGTEVTRGFPIKPRAGERIDHPHQIGLWLTYGNVNDLDFWGNGSGGLGTTNPNGGVIKHLSVKKMSGGNGEGSLVTEESWRDLTGKEILKENSNYYFIASGSTRIIDRITTLTAVVDKVEMKDTKEGMFGIRVARQMELPLKDNVTLFSADGHPTEVKAMSNEGITGNYRSSEGVSGEEVWGKRAKWMILYGSIGSEKISLVICDHPKNQGYPTYWHARGYGLFSANPLGWNDFTNGQQQLNLALNKGQSVTFRYRVIIATGSQLSDGEVNAYAAEFAKKYPK